MSSGLDGVLVVYCLVVGGVIGYYVGRSMLRREEKVDTLHSRLWELEAKLRETQHPLGKTAKEAA